jgi:hypothetical protein
LGATDGQESKTVQNQESQESSERRGEKSKEGSPKDAQIVTDVKSGAALYLFGRYAVCPTAT